LSSGTDEWPVPLQDLDLSKNLLNGSIPATITQLTQLQCLDLSDNQLSGELPDSMELLYGLQHFSAHRNRLIGGIPLSFGSLQYLQYLDLSHNDLSSTLFPSLGEMRALQSLDLSANNIGGEIPAKLGQLSSLAWLDLSTNHLVGGIPDSIGSLSQLQCLILSQNRLTGSLPSTLTVLSQLTWLYVNNNSLSGVLPPNLGAMTSLEVLNLQSNSITGRLPDSIGNALNLTQIYLDWNELSGPLPDSLGNLTHLVYLHLYSNRITGGIGSSLGNLRQLVSLDLGYNLLRGPIPTSLGNLSNLQQLYLDSNSLAGRIPASLGSLSYLNYLDLSFNSLVGEVPDSFVQLQSLTFFSVSSNRLSGPLPAFWGNLTELTSLGFGLNAFTGPIPDTWRGLVNLQMFDVGSNRLSGSIPQWLPELRQLATLDLDTNAFTGTIPDVIGSMSNLTGLYLGANQLTSSIPRSLGNLSKLIILGLGLNHLHGSIPIELGQLVNLEQLYAPSNLLTGDIPPALMALPSLLTLSLSQNQLTGPFPLITNSTGLQGIYFDGNMLSGPIPANVTLLPNLTFLHLRENILSGGIPSQLAELQYLQELDLSFNELSGTMPPGLLQLSNLTVLHLSSNSLSGDMMFDLSTTAQLQTFNVSSNFDLAVPQNVTLRSFVGAQATMQSLGMSGISLPPGFLSELPSLPRALILNFASSNISGIIGSDMLQRFPALFHLFVQSNQLTGPLPSLPAGLRSLIAFSNDFTSMPDLQDVHNLTNLVLDGNRRMQGQLPTDWGVFTKLRVLSAQHCNLDGQVATGLLALSLRGTLQTIALRDNFLSGPLHIGADAANFPSPTSSLRILDLGQNSFDGAIPATITEHMRLAPALRVLRIDDNYLSCSLEPLSGVQGEFANGSFAVLLGNSFQCPVPEAVNRLDSVSKSYHCDTAPWLTDMLASGVALVFVFASLVWSARSSRTSVKGAWLLGACGGRHTAWMAICSLTFCLMLFHWGVLYPSLYKCAGGMWGSGAYHRDAEPVTLFIILCLFALSIIVFSFSKAKSQAQSPPAGACPEGIPIGRLADNGRTAPVELAGSTPATASSSCQQMIGSIYKVSHVHLIILALTLALWAFFFCINAFFDIGLVLLLANAWNVQATIHIPHLMAVALAVSSLCKTGISSVLLPRSARLLYQYQLRLYGLSSNLSTRLTAPGALFAATSICAGLMIPLIVGLVQMQDCFASNMPWATETPIPIRFEYDVCTQFCFTAQSATAICPNEGGLPGCYFVSPLSQEVSVPFEAVWRGTCSSATFRLFAPQATLMLAIQAAQVLFLALIQWRSGHTLGELALSQSKTALHAARQHHCCRRCRAPPSSRSAWLPRPRARSATPSGGQVQLRQNVINPLAVVTPSQVADPENQVAAAAAADAPANRPRRLKPVSDGAAGSAAETTEPSASSVHAKAGKQDVTFYAIQVHVAVLVGAVFGAVYPPAILACMATVTAYFLAKHLVPESYANDAPVPKWMRSAMLVVYTASVWFAYGPGSMLADSSLEGARGGLSALTVLVILCIAWRNLSRRCRSSTLQSLL